MFAFSTALEPPVPKNARVPGDSFRQGARRSEALRPVRAAFVFLAFCLLFQPRAHPQLKEVRRVVVFYELGLSSPAVKLIDREIRATLDNSHYQIELYPEYLETTLFDDAVDQRELRESYIRKYQRRRPDLIIALGPSPVRFMIDSHREILCRHSDCLWRHERAAGGQPHARFRVYRLLGNV